MKTINFQIKTVKVEPEKRIVILRQEFFLCRKSEAELMLAFEHVIAKA